jgi:hypothetical protein
MTAREELPENEAQALITHLEQLIHDLAQPLLGARFTSEFLASQLERISKEDLALKIDLIRQAINESNAISSALSADLQKLRKFLQ